MIYFSKSSSIAVRLKSNIEYRNKCLDIREKCLPIITKNIEEFNKGYNNYDCYMSLSKSINFKLNPLFIGEIKVPVIDRLYRRSSINDENIEEFFIFYLFDNDHEYVGITKYYTKESVIENKKESDVFITQEWVFTIEELTNFNAFSLWLDQFSFPEYVKQYVSVEEYILNYINNLTAEEVGFNNTIHYIDYLDGTEIHFVVVLVDNLYYGFIYNSKLYRLSGINLGYLKFSANNEWINSNRDSKLEIEEREKRVKKLITKYKDI